MNLIKTGISGLDEVLYGGFVPNNAMLVEGTRGLEKRPWVCNIFTGEL